MNTREGKLAEEYLEKIPSFAGKKSPIPKIREFLTLLGNPDREFFIFHVAGTNGKGSVCAFLSSIFHEAGIPCGTFVSPHLWDLRERFLIDGNMPSEEAFSEAFEAVLETAKRWQEAGNPHPTYFEFLFYMGLVLFQKAQVPIAVIETGMGGTYDATNAIERPAVSVITSISIDHTAYLGSTIKEIAAHKAGIVKPGCPVVFDASAKEAAAVISERAIRCGSHKEPVSGISCSFSESFKGAGGIEIQIPFQGEDTRFFLPFEAPYQAVNGALALKALETAMGETAMGGGEGCPGHGWERREEYRRLLGTISKETVMRGLEHTRWPARMEQVRPGIYLDGAHNADGIRAFLEAAGEICERKRPVRTLLVFAVSSDKEYESMLREIAERLNPSPCLLTAADSSRALPEKELLRAAGKAGLGRGEIYYYEKPSEAFAAAVAWKQEGDLVFIAGSLYLAGEIKEYLHDQF